MCGSVAGRYGASSSNTFADFHALYIQNVYTESYGFELNGNRRGGSGIDGTVKYNASTKMIRYTITFADSDNDSLSNHAYCFLYMQ